MAWASYLTSLVCCKETRELPLLFPLCEWESGFQAERTDLIND